MGQSYEAKLQTHHLVQQGELTFSHTLHSDVLSLPQNLSPSESAHLIDKTCSTCHSLLLFTSAVLSTTNSDQTLNAWCTINEHSANIKTTISPYKNFNVDCPLLDAIRRHP